jgi:TRAP-type C4-dicarboxylate transport system substrate-binding protein
MTWRAGPVALTAAALVAVAAGCGGSGDKAGGGTREKPLVLTLESEDDLSLTGAPEFAAAVERVSERAMRIELVPAGRGAEAEFEKGVVEDVRDGRAQLGIVDARVWDTIGVNSFQAIVAPFLIDSLGLERRVLESPLATRMLDGVEQVGVVGIALLPGPLRHPFGISRPLLGPDDYRGTTIGIRPAGLARTALRALQADAKVYVPGSLAGLDGLDSNPKAIDFNGWEGVLTRNVVLWPKPFTIVMNRDAFDALTAEQQELLRDAGREAIRRELDDLVRGGSEALSKACAEGAVRLVSASAADLAALREAVQPVYEELESDPDTKEVISDITDMRSAEPAPAAVALAGCRRAGRRAGGSANAATTALEGRWSLTFTRDDLVAVGVPEKSLRKDLPSVAHLIVQFASNGRYTATAAAGTVVVRGTYSVRGDVMSLVFHPPVPSGYVARHVYRLRWNIYRDRLTFSRLPGSDWDGVLLTNSLTRIR